MIIDAYKAIYKKELESVIAKALLTIPERIWKNGKTPAELFPNIPEHKSRIGNFTRK